MREFIEGLNEGGSEGLAFRQTKGGLAKTKRLSSGYRDERGEFNRGEGGWEPQLISQ